MRERDYRAYILNIDGHRFVWAKEFSNSYPNDAAALNVAKQLTDKHDVEVWEGSRLVARLSPDGKGLSPELAPSLSPDCENNSVKPADAEKERRLNWLHRCHLIARTVLSDRLNGSP
jgi:hypothetical protein